MKTNDIHPAAKDRLLTAQQTARALNLPECFLSDATRRRQLGIPHYRIHSLVRFRLPEVAAWQARRSEAEAAERERQGTRP
ncbi:DNA-binding protein [Aquabacterium sp. A7-Y]|uniref:DNA-binding protein n=1 Tax=Aquabacterium sp. A7-Y TaxID=1349605 RepID=UPI00223CCA83|nr:DNA-binding protein [Aquabacterium sp. A7-Y]MCW7536246.1 DNA-binding protein [Aquabacterium sp. A7-Y]